MAPTLGLAVVAIGETPAELGLHFDYFYIEANEGGSAGGHAAIRLGDSTYHFQYAPTGLLEMARTPTADFLSQYALLSNRSIHVTRVGTDRETLDAIGRAFNRRYLSQRRQLRRLALLRDGPDWLEGEAVRLPVAGAGYFDPDRRSPVVQHLRDRIGVRYGSDVVERREQAEEATARRTIETESPERAEILSEALHALTAIEILRAGRGLRERWLVEDDPPSSELTGRDRVRLVAIRTALEDRLVDLFDSRRSDWGTPFLVGLARLLALERSLERGRLVFLDTFPSDTLTLTPRGERWDRVGAELLGRAQERFDAAKRRLMSGDGYREQDLTRLEAATNRLADMRRGVTRSEPIRMAGGRLLPARAAPGVALEGVDSERLAGTLRRAHARYLEELLDGQSYHVVARNCVSAIFETIDQAMAALAGSDSLEPVRAESIRRLGGHLRPSATLGFVPFVSSRQVRARYRVVDSFVVVSDRQARLREMRRAESGLRVHLRESNVLTSTIYDSGGDDSVFLFFTEDEIATRPIYGALNLAVGLGGSVLGLLWTPFDQGELLVDGLRGALASLPELFFVNIRKGSNDYVVTGSERESLEGDLAF